MNISKKINNNKEIKKDELSILDNQNMPDRTSKLNFTQREKGSGLEL